jgi:hypothetical protein
MAITHYFSKLQEKAAAQLPLQANEKNPVQEI